MTKKNGAPKGNTNNNKRANFPEECVKAYADYCKWLAQGNSIKSWVYKSKTMSLTYKSMEKYIHDFPLDFPPQQKEEALAKSLTVWEKRGLDMMLGKVEKCQPALFQMFMRNKFGWDKEEKHESTQTATMLSELLQHWKNN